MKEVTASGKVHFVGAEKMCRRTVGYPTTTRWILQIHWATSIMLRQDLPLEFSLPFFCYAVYCAFAVEEDHVAVYGIVWR